MQLSTADQISAHRTTLRASLISTLVALVSLPLEVPRYGFWPLGLYDLLQALQGAAFTFFVWRFGKKCSTRFFDAMLVALLAPCLVSMWLPPVSELAIGEPIEPLLPHQFMMLGVAILSPSSYRLAVAVILVFGGEALVLYLYLRAHGAGPSLAHEPYFTLITMGVALGLQRSFFRRRALTRELAMSEARAEAHASTMRAFLAVRDHANSPLQTLEVGFALLERRAPGQRSVVAPLRSAVGKLVEIQRGLTALERRD